MRIKREEEEEEKKGIMIKIMMLIIIMVMVMIMMMIVMGLLSKLYIQQMHLSICHNRRRDAFLNSTMARGFNIIYSTNNNVNKIK